VTKDVCSGNQGDPKREEPGEPSVSANSQAACEAKGPMVLSGPAAGAGSPPPSDRPPPSRSEAVRNVVEIAYRCLLIALLLAGVGYGVPIFQAQHAKAQRDEVALKAELLRRETADKRILDMDLSAAVLGGPEKARFVLITLEIKNTGNRVISVPTERIKATITRVGDVDEAGQIKYGTRYPFRFGDWPESSLKKLEFSPGERAKYQTIQRLRDDGLHLLTVEISLGKEDDSEQTFRSVLFSHFD
jgi:hypothetical protein